jgi:magnesium transporter
MTSKLKQTMTPEVLARLREQIRSNPQSMTEVIDRLKAPDAAEIINDLSLEDAVLTIRLMPLEEAVAVMNEPSCERRHKILQEMDLETVANIFSELSSDERAYIMRRMLPDYRAQLLPSLTPNIRQEIQFLLQFSSTTAGGIMSTEFVRLSPESSVGEALNHIRATSKKRSHVYSAYVVDEEDHLLGAISLRDLVVANPNRAVQEVMRKYPILVNAQDDQEKVGRLLAKYNLLALPVVDVEKRVVGFVTVDDALDVLTDEETEDVHKLAGIAALDESYMTVPLAQMIRKRAGWLVLLFIGEMFTASAMSFFEDEIAKAVVLALFVPLIISSGGNTGSQAATLIIRSLALGEATIEDWSKILQREAVTGLVLGSLLGFIGFLRIGVWNYFLNTYGPHWFGVGLTVFLSLIGVVLWGTISGSMLPLILKHFGVDPATSSTPFVATLVDVTGLVIYFSIAAVILRGTLLP